MILNIPLPPPLSACFNNVPGRGRVPSKRYRQWQESAKTELYAQLWSQRRLTNWHPPYFVDAVKVEYFIARPDRRRRDLDNLGKALCDILKKCGVLNDDSQIVDVRFAWREGKGVEAHITPVDDALVAA